MEEIRLSVQNLGSFLDDVECVVLFEPALPVEMVFKKGDVRLSLFRFGKELLVGRDVHGRGLNLSDAFPPRAHAQGYPISTNIGMGSRGRKMEGRTSLTTRSCVLTVIPFSS